MAISSLMVRLDSESKQYLAEAAKLRGISISDYVRLTTVEQAKKEVLAAEQNIIVLTAEEQLELWNALQAPVKLTPAQKKLSAIMRGKA